MSKPTTGPGPRAEAVGKFPREFNNLRFAILGAGGPALISAEKAAARGKRSLGGSGKNNRGIVWYWLRKVTHHTADPTVLPTDAEFNAAVDRGVSNYLEDMKK
ncbi:MAG: hypothetical protein LBD30_07975 [Verrucomicrobiales bacterium]|nr:hypothetical protein [Verrucomicrobiales bacterium]